MTIEQEITKNMTSAYCHKMPIKGNVKFIIIDQFTNPETNTQAKILSLSQEEMEIFKTMIDQGTAMLFPIPKKTLPHIVDTMNTNQIGEYLQKVIKRENWKPTAVNFYAALANLNMQYDYN